MQGAKWGPHASFLLGTVLVMAPLLPPVAVKLIAPNFCFMYVPVKLSPEDVDKPSIGAGGIGH